MSYRFYVLATILIIVPNISKYKSRMFNIALVCPLRVLGLRKRPRFHFLQKYRKLLEHGTYTFYTHAYKYPYTYVGTYTHTHTYMHAYIHD